MKKTLFGMLAASMAMNVYLVNVEVVVKDELDEEYLERDYERPQRDQITIAQAGVEKQNKNQKLQEECSPKIVEKIVYKDSTDQEPIERLEPAERFEEEPSSEALKTITRNDLDSMSRDEMSELAQSYNQQWSKKSKDFFEYRLGLSSDQMGEYSRLKSEMEEEIAAMLEKSAPDFAGEARMMTSEEMMEMGRIHEKYADKLKRSFGPSAYDEYLSFRESYNKKLAAENRGVFGINF